MSRANAMLNTILFHPWLATSYSRIGIRLTIDRRHEMLEVEMKFGVADFAPIVQRLQEWRAAADQMIDEADHYFNAPDRDFAQTDEAFRLRRIGPKNLLTYKGPKSPGLVKTRAEIEVPLADGPLVAEDMS